MNNTDSNKVRAHLGMLLRALILGLSFSAVGLMAEGLPPLLLTALRFAVAVAVLLPFVWRTPNWLPSPTGLALYGALGLCQAAFFGSMFWAAHRTTALSMTVLYVVVPFLAYCLGRGFRVEPPRGRLVGILALGASGALGLAGAERGGRSGGLHLGSAEAVYFAGCFAIAFYPVLSTWGLAHRWISERASARTFWSLVVGGVLVGALGLMRETPQALARFTPSDVLLLAYLGVFSTGFTFWLMQRAAAVLTPGEATAYSYVPPFVSMLLLFVTDPQSISWRWLPGAALVVLAIALLLRLDADPKSRSPSALPTAKPVRGSR
ncbi:MAG TPA: DMT family transporter [Myxococcaceae bacterium]|nr:DMT family transporter [Myxococcaceae bacterium]